MDPAAQPNVGTVNNKILPGQFIQIGEDPHVELSTSPSIPTAPAAQIKMPDSSAPAGVGSASAPPIPPPPVAPSAKPFLHLASNSAEVGLTSSNPAPIPPPPPTPTQSTINISNPPPQNFSNQQPDPTPFVAPGQSAEFQSHVQPPEPQKSSKGKVIFLSLGVLALVGIVGAVAYFFVFNKNLPLGAKVEDTIKSQLEDLPPLPKRIKGGFADIPQISVFFAQAASPSASPGLEIPAN